jgi:hypothetical protein
MFARQVFYYLSHFTSRRCFLESGLDTESKEGRWREMVGLGTGACLGVRDIGWGVTGG